MKKVTKKAVRKTSKKVSPYAITPFSKVLLALLVLSIALLVTFLKK